MAAGKRSKQMQKNEPQMAVLSSSVIVESLGERDVQPCGVEHPKLFQWYYIRASRSIGTGA